MGVVTYCGTLHVSRPIAAALVALRAEYCIVGIPHNAVIYGCLR